MARLFVFLGGLLALALCVALIAPHYIDWTQYRSDFEREFSKVIGRQVHVRGDANMRLLPFPSVTFHDVEVVEEGRDEPIMSVEKFSMDLELAPFMRGEVLIFDMRLEQPRAVLNIDDQGQIDWALRPKIYQGLSQVTLESVKIIDGEISISHGASQTMQNVTHINGELSAQTLAGPWRFNATMLANEEPLELTISTGSVDDQGSMRLKMKLEPELYPFDFSSDGRVVLNDGIPDYRGKFSIQKRAQINADLLDVEGKAQNKGDAAKNITRLNGDFIFDHQSIALTQFQFENGAMRDPYLAQGKAQVLFGSEPYFEVQASGQQLNLDGSIEGENVPAQSLEIRLAAFRQALSDIPRPNISGRVDLALPAIVSGDTTIRDVVLKAEPNLLGWTINEFRAKLPGRSILEADGDLFLGDKFRFLGNLLMAIRQPSGFASWLHDDVDQSIRSLDGAGFNAQVDLSPERQIFSKLELSLGGAKFLGSIHRASPDKLNPSMSFELQGGALDIEDLVAFGSIFVSDTGTNRFSRHDLDIKLKAGPVSAFGIEAEEIDSAIRLKQGRLDVDRLSVFGLGEAIISATASLRDFPLNPTGQVDVSVIAQDLAPLIDTLDRRFPANELLPQLKKRGEYLDDFYKDAQLNFLVDLKDLNEDKQIDVQSNGIFGATRFDASLAAISNGWAFDSSKIDLKIEAKNPSAIPIFTAYGLETLPLNLTKETQTRFSLQGRLNEKLDVNASISNDTAVFGASAQILHKGGAGAVIDGTLTLEGEDIQPWLLETGYGVAGLDIALPVLLSSPFSWSDETLSLSKISNELATGLKGGSLQLKFDDDRPQINGSLAMTSLDLKPFSTILLGDISAPRHVGNDQDISLWSNQAFPANVHFPFLGQLNLTLDVLQFGQDYQVQEPKFDLTINDNRLRLANFTGRLDGAQIEGQGQVSNDEGVGLFSSQLKIIDGDIENFLGLDWLHGQADIVTNLSSSGHSMKALVASMSGSGTVNARDVKMTNFNGDAFDAIIQGADEIGADINEDNSAAFVMPLLQLGELKLGDIEFDYSIASGIARTAQFRAKIPQGEMAVTMRANFNSGVANLDGQFTYEPGFEALIGSLPSVGWSFSGTLDGGEFAYDTAPLARFLTQRALELEQARVQALQASLLEKQRLRREARYYRDIAIKQKQGKLDAARLQFLNEERALQEQQDGGAKPAKSATQPKLNFDSLLQ